MKVFDITPCTFLFSLKDKNWEQELTNFCDFFKSNLPDSLQNNSEQKKNVMDIKGKFRQVPIRQSIGNNKLSNTNNNNKKKNASSSSSQSDLKLHPSFLGEKNSSYLWLLKPTNLNRGRGIELFSNLNQLETLLSNYFEGFYE